MKKTFMIAVVAALFLALSTGFSYARQGRGNGNSGGWSNCPYWQSASTRSQQSSKSGWYCPRTGSWTNTRNHLGPRGSGGGYGYGQGANRNQTSNN